MERLDDTRSSRRCRHPRMSSSGKDDDLPTARVTRDSVGGNALRSWFVRVRVARHIACLVVVSSSAPATSDDEPRYRDEEDADDEPADPWGEIQATGIEVRPGIAVEPGDVLRYGGAGVGRFVGTQTYEGKNFALLRYADSQTLFIPMDKTNAFEKVSDSTPLDRLPKNDAGDS